MRAYSEQYLSHAAATFGAMMDYAVNDCDLDGDVFLSMFITSGIAEQFEQRNKDINKAQAITLTKIARVLGCGVESLLEYDNESVS